MDLSQGLVVRLQPTQLINNSASKIYADPSSLVTPKAGLLNRAPPLQPYVFRFFAGPAGLAPAAAYLVWEPFASVVVIFQMALVRGPLEIAAGVVRELGTLRSSIRAHALRECFEFVQKQAFALLMSLDCTAKLFDQSYLKLFQVGGQPHQSNFGFSGFVAHALPETFDLVGEVSH